MRIARAQTKSEEVANSIVHGLGVALSIAALVTLLVKSAQMERATLVVASAIFGTSMVALYLSSTIYHALPPGPSKSLFRVVDHSAIYLLIAGTYTPFALGPLRGPWGWSLLGAVWTLAALGIYAKVKLGFVYPRLSTHRLAATALTDAGRRPLVAAGRRHLLHGRRAFLRERRADPF
jgi:hemolysin III